MLYFILLSFDWAQSPSPFCVNPIRPIGHFSFGPSDSIQSPIIQAHYSKPRPAGRLPPTRMVTILVRGLRPVKAQLPHAVPFFLPCTFGPSAYCADSSGTPRQSTNQRNSSIPSWPAPDTPTDKPLLQLVSFVTQRISPHPRASFTSQAYLPQLPLMQPKRTMSVAKEPLQRTPPASTVSALSPRDQATCTRASAPAPAGFLPCALMLQPRMTHAAMLTQDSYANPCS